jgi:hypothetical protein
LNPSHNREPVQDLYYFLEEIGILRDYFVFAERNRLEEFERYKAKFQEHDDTLDDRFNERLDLWASFETEYPQYLRRSSILITFSMFEDNLNKFCDSMAEYKCSALRFSDMSGRGIERSKNYLSKAIGMDFPSSTSEWEKITKVQKVRNILAHTSGYLDEQRHKDILEIAEKNVNLEVKSFARNEIFIKPEYVLEFLGDIESFYKNLIQVYRTQFA